MAWIRTLLFLLVALTWARASSALPEPKAGLSNVVKQPHVTAHLISEITDVAPGKPFQVALHLRMDPSWHTYWINPGDAGLATVIKWTLPPGFTAGPIQWPTPESHLMGPLTTYGYDGDVYLLTTITPPEKIAAHLPLAITARAGWLVCQEQCIPGKGDLTVQLGAPGSGEPVDNQAFFAAAKARLPVPNTEWKVSGAYGAQTMTLQLTAAPGVVPKLGAHSYFFPEQGNAIDPREDGTKLVAGQAPGEVSWPLALQQNGEKPAHLSGVLVSDQPLQGDGAKAIYFASFPVTSGDSAAPSSAAAPAASSLENVSPSPAAAPSAPVPPAASAQPWLIAVLGAAFLGGLILNLMPCVLPVLSLKVFSLIRHAGTDSRTAWRQGAAFTVGVVLSFWILAGLLIALRAAGNHLGWGFQMQSPGFVLALIFLFFLLGLNLLGVFELGTSLVGLDAKATGHAGQGLTSSFLNGALATLAATPCTAPFMGSSVGFAAGQPPAVAMLIFTFLAFGMATPYLLLTIFPAALRFVPKPGAWMEAFKQFMGFLLLASVIFLVYVFGALVGQEQIPALLGALLLLAIGMWIYGRWSTQAVSESGRADAILLTLIAAGGALFWGIGLAQTTAPSDTAVTALGSSWQPWSSGAVDAALAKNQPVFVDFTAAWCLSCKVNERVALDTASVKAAFSQKHVALFRADWTHSDPAISKVLEDYHRDGVPLYLLYSPGNKTAPEVLPEVLTPGLVLDAVKGA